MAVSDMRQLNMSLSKVINMKWFVYFLLMIGLSKAKEPDISGKELRVIIAHVSIFILPSAITKCLLIHVHYGYMLIFIVPSNCYYNTQFKCGHIIGFGGILYEELDWMSKLLNFK